MRRYKLGKKELKRIKNVAMLWNIKVEECDVIDEGRKKIYLCNDLPYFVEENDIIYPTVIALLNEDEHRIKKVIVNMGAVKPITNGANVFAAGIIDASEDIAEGDIVGVYDEKYGKAIAVGLAEMCGRDMKNLNKGLAIRNLSHIGDELWKRFVR